MITLAYAINDSEWSVPLFNAYLKLLPLCFTEKISRLQRWQDAQATILGKLLLRHILLSYKNDFTINDIKITNEGKPFIDDSFDFNITHAGSYVICSYSDEGRIGVDLEKVNQINLENFESIFTSDELNHITLSADPSSTFYTFWTIKEAAIKADGRGLSIPLKEVKITQGKVFVQSVEWFYKMLDFKRGYILHMVTDKNIYGEISFLSPNLDIQLETS